MVTNSFLTVNERRISGSLTDIDNDTDSEDWWKAKTGNASAALRIVKKIWKNENSEKFLQIIDKKCVPFCISVPSTSGSNMIADTLTEYIAKSINGIFISGKTLYKINTEIQNYIKIKNVDFLVEQQVIVVDDIISDASIFKFIHTLRKDGIKTTFIACLFSDAIVTLSQKKEKIHLPLIYRGCSTIDLLKQWDRILSGTADGSGNATAGIMNEFLMEYRLCPVSWSRIAWEEDKERARFMIEELQNRVIATPCEIKTRNAPSVGL